MDQKTLDSILKLLQSEADGDAIMGLRALQAYVREENVDFGRAMSAMLAQLPTLKNTPVAAAPTPVDTQSAAGAAPTGALQCRAVGGALEIHGANGAEKVLLPALAAESASLIAESLKDAIVAANLTKSRMKLKLADMRDNRGEVLETILRAEYDRAGMTPIVIWSNTRGEVAALAAVLRKAMTTAMPELMAA